MKRLLYALPFLVSLSFSVSSYAQSWLWAKQPVFVGHPPTQSNGEAFAMATDNQGNAYSTGEFAYANMIYGSTTLSTVNNPDFFLTKHDPAGNVVWAKQATLFSDYCVSVGNSVATDTAGNIFVTGVIRDSVAFGNQLLIATHGSEVFVAKYDPDGNVLWVKQSQINSFNGYQNEGLSIAVDRAGNAYVTGDFHNTTAFGSFTLSCPSGSSGNVFIVKYDPNGNEVWAKQADIPSNSSSGVARAITADAYNNVYITGNFHDTITFGSQTLIGHSVVGDVFVAKCDNNGNFIWARQSTNSSTEFWSNGPISGNAITTDRSGNVYVTGNFEDVIHFDTYTLTNPVNFAYSFPYGDMMVVKYDANGNVLWAKQADPQSNAAYAGWGVATDTVGHLYLACGAFAFSGTKNNYSINFGGSNFTMPGAASIECTLLLQLDTNGTVQCGSAIPIGGDDYSAIAVDPSGQHVYMNGDYYWQFNITVGPSTLSGGSNPPNQGVEIPFLVRWSPCNVVLAPSVTINKINATCLGLCNGSATASGSGGRAPYSYSWNTSPVKTTPTVSGLCAGQYTVVVTDSLGLTASGNVTITEPAVLSVTASHDTTICPGGIATLKATSTGGTPVITYKWSPSAGLSSTTGSLVTATPSSSTVYTVTATGIGGCTSTDSVAVTISSGIPVSVSITADPPGPVCKGTPVTFTATPTNGGVPAYQWKLNGVNVGASSTVYLTDSLKNNDVVICIMNSSLNCVSGSPATSNSLTATIIPHAQAGIITAEKDTVCAGDNGILHVTGNTTAVQWQSTVTGTGFTTIPGADSTSYSAPLSQNTYFRVFAGIGSCSDTSLPHMVTVNALPSPPSLTTSDSLICTGDSAQICANGQNFSYLWNTGSTNSCIEAKNAGAYWVTATASNGCSVISSHAGLAIYPVSSVSIVVQGDTLASFNAVAYQWILNGSPLPGDTGRILIAQTGGQYAVAVTDTNGCVVISNPVTITGIEGLKDNGLMVFPNPSHSGIFTLLVSPDWLHSQLDIFDVDGRIVYDATVLQTKSDILLNHLPDAVYMLRIYDKDRVASQKLLK